MAEIRVRPQRRSLVWLWILLTVAVLALIAWYLVSSGTIRVRSGDAPGGASGAAAALVRAAPSLVLT